MLALSIAGNEEILLLDTVANCHGIIKLADRTKRAAIAIQLPPSVIVLRDELLPTLKPQIRSGIEDALSDSPELLTTKYVGNFCSGTIAGTPDIVKRGLIVAVLGNLNERAETPIRFLIKDTFSDWYVLNPRPVTLIQYSRLDEDEKEMVNLFSGKLSDKALGLTFGY